jgi:hypothetical protein
MAQPVRNRRNPQPRTKSAVSLPRARLIERMQRLGFGTIEGLVIRDGDPVLTPPPHVVRDVKFCAENGPRRETGLSDFTLKAPVEDFLANLDAIGNGTIRSLEVRHGLPFRMQVEEDPA